MLKRYWVLAASAAVGVNVTVRLSADSESVPGTPTPVLLITRYKFPGVIVSGLMGAEYTTVIATDFDTAVALSTGVKVTPGVESSVSVAGGECLRHSSHRVTGQIHYAGDCQSIGRVGLRAARAESALKRLVRVAQRRGDRQVRAVLRTEVIPDNRVGWMGSLNRIWTEISVGTLVNAFGGLVATTVGAVVTAAAEVVK